MDLFCVILRILTTTVYHRETMKSLVTSISLMTALAISSLSFYSRADIPVSQSPKGAKIYFVEPKNGDQVTSPVTVKFGLEGMTVVPAGVPHPDSGHHHLLVDLEALPDLTKPIPGDKNHLHFGKAQTETQLQLAPGKHTLQLLLGDHLHRPHHEPVVSEKITITVLPKE